MEAPDRLKASTSVLNIQNRDDNECVRWALTAGLERLENIRHKDPQRVSSYRNSPISLDLTGITYPTPISEVSYSFKFGMVIVIRLTLLDYTSL